MKTKKKVTLSASEVARKGGMATLKKYSKDHFSKIAKKRWRKEKSKNK